MSESKDFVKKYWAYITFYIFAIVVVFLQNRFRISVDQNTILIILLALLPIFFSKLSTFEYGGIKLQLRELKNEVIDTKQEVRREVSEVKDSYRQLSEKLVKTIERSQAFLKPQPLKISDDIAEEMRQSINLSDEDIETGLNSLDTNIRLPAYIQLQVKPQIYFLSKLIDCFWIEQFEISRNRRTRPLWQLLVAAGSYIDRLSDEISTQEHQRMQMVFQHTLDFLKSDDSIDRGNQCKERLKLLIENLKEK